MELLDSALSATGPGLLDKCSKYVGGGGGGVFWDGDVPDQNLP